MRLLLYLTLGVSLLAQQVLSISTAQSLKPRQQNSGTTEVQWDSDSFIIQGQRLYGWSAEFHFWRLPAPDLWRDILQKLKAAGFNGVSCYVHWGATNPSEGRVEWDGYRDFELWIQMAHEVGLWVVARHGPYINGETSAGGIPGRVTNIAGFLRSNDSDYYESYQDYYRSATDIIRRYQVTEGGPIVLVQVDNEYTNNTNFATPNPVTKNQYMQALEDILREMGIVLPLTSNDSYQGQNFAPGRGNLTIGDVDVYGLDSYPQGSCATPDLWSTFPIDNWNYHLATNPTQPLLYPEFQGGSFLGWGPNSPQYTECNVLTGSNFEQVYYLNQFATGVKWNNIYMTFGGTSWGFFPFPGVYTSYDYGAAIAEDRSLTGKWNELKNIGTFIQSVQQDLSRSTIIGNNSVAYTDNPNVFVTELRNLFEPVGRRPAIYVVRQTETSSNTTVQAKLRISTSAGNFTVPQTANMNIELVGRQSRAVITDHSVGEDSSVLYSTASLFYSGSIGGRDVLVLHGPSGQSFEAVVNLRGFDASSSFTGEKSSVSTQPSFKAPPGFTPLTFSPSEGQMAISISDTSILIIGDTDSMTPVFAPIIPGADDKAYWLTSTNQTVLVHGPALVRNATISGETIELWGDTNPSSSSATQVTVYAPEDVTSVSWNGKFLSNTSVQRLAAGILQFSVGGGVAPKITVPDLSAAKWKISDSLPEIGSGYDDSKWVVADRVNSTNPFFKYYGENYLYACEYGFCEGPVLWRGHFNSTGHETAVNLSITGGRGFAGSVWLNDVFLGATYGNSSNNNGNVIVETTNQTYAFPDGSLARGGNVITVLHDNMGMEEAQANQFTEWLKTPRGIQGYFLLGGTSQPQWKVQGKLGGFQSFPDRVRGIMNEGGFFGDRAGWHLPGFDDSKWNTTSLAQPILQGAGVRYLRTTFDLDVPAGYDVKMSLNFPPYGSGSYRVFFYVNGWNMGRYVANLGPQSRFVVPQGILNYSGVNTLVLAVWATSNDGARIDSLDLTVDSIMEGGIGHVATNNPGWAKRDSF
ncbi:glycoside hydrolase superfamily [Roridomyces roridus]|uniref:beta-galactosidase n=1 Tax=Roridomyces roridus TaxID=1738132 RepID=A0AAD7B9Q6_9AGAR|nr:glycoside hydrolase superfamily [Roridomyces roridus]